jgi:hypothetical protein
MNAEPMRRRAVHRVCFALQAESSNELQVPTDRGRTVESTATECYPSVGDHVAADGERNRNHYRWRCHETGGARCFIKRGAGGPVRKTGSVGFPLLWDATVSIVDIGR